MQPNNRRQSGRRDAFGLLIYDIGGILTLPFKHRRRDWRNAFKATSGDIAHDLREILFPKKER